MNELGIVLLWPRRLEGTGKTNLGGFLIQEDLTMEGEFINNIEK
jgi:hypothetical protein